MESATRGSATYKRKLIKFLNSSRKSVKNHESDVNGGAFSSSDSEITDDNVCPIQMKPKSKSIKSDNNNTVKSKMLIQNKPVSDSCPQNKIRTNQWNNLSIIKTDCNGYDILNIFPSDGSSSDSGDSLMDIEDYEGLVSSIDLTRNKEVKDDKIVSCITETSQCQRNSIDEVQKDSIGDDQDDFDEEDENLLESEDINIPVAASNFSVTKHVDYFYNNNALVILLHDSVKLYFHGCAKVTVLNGEVNILGYTLRNSTSSVNVFSPRGASFLYFEWKSGFKTSLPEDLLKWLECLYTSNKQFCNKIQPNTAVILCERIEETKLNFMEKHIAQQIFPKCDDGPNFILQDDNALSTWNVLKISHDWDKLIDLFGPASRIFICGGKSVGKSVFLRYAINKLLMKYPEILVIDLDPGQPEFTISGCISASIVKKPVFGPNYTHLQKPHRCFYTSDVNIGYEPSRYLNTIKLLMNSCKDLSKTPTLINYMGFIRGIGLDLLCASIAYSHPTDVIEIKSTMKQRNYQIPLTYELVSTLSKRLAPEIHYITPFTIHTLPSMADDNQGWHLQPRQIRELCILSYFGDMLPYGSVSLTNEKVDVYEIDLALIKIMHKEKLIHPAVANANLVALCTRSSLNLYECLGWGIVRAINLTTNKLFLLTPLTEEHLQNVEYLMVGSITLPPSIYMTSDNTVGLLPYVTSYRQPFLQGQIPKRSYLPKKVSMPKM